MSDAAYGEDVHAWARERFGGARVARLATLTPSGDPHVVPVVFALAGEVIWTPVDAKPKSGRRLQRLRNIEADPRVTLLVDHYDEDWSSLWWVRADGVATIVSLESEHGRHAVELLTAKYPQYAAEPPPGPLIRVDVAGWRSWSAG